MMTQSLQCHMNTKRCFETGVSWFGLVFVAIGLLTWGFFFAKYIPTSLLYSRISKSLLCKENVSLRFLKALDHQATVTSGACYTSTTTDTTHAAVEGR